MFLHFLRFELRYYLRAWMVWIFFLLVGLMVFGATASDNVVIGGALGNTRRNAPWVIQNFYGIVSVITLLMTTAFVNNSAIRDYLYNTHQMVFSLPIGKRAFVLGRFLGAAAVAVIPLLGVSAGVLAARLAPWIDAERFGPVAWHAHWNGLIGFAIPNTLFIAAILFSLALVFRSTTVSFLGAIALLVVLSVADALSSDLKNETLAAMLDPFGSRAFTIATKYWTVAERNARSLPLTGLFLWNRLTWLAVGFGVFGLVSWRLNLGERASRKKRKSAVEDAPAAPLALPRTRASWSGAAAWAQYRGATRFELASMVRTPVFIVILSAALLNCLAALIFSTPEVYGNKTFPVTYWTTSVMQGTLYTFLIAIITFFAGQLVWRERDDRVDEMQDSLPMRDWLLYTSKLTALLVAIACILGATVAAGIVVQAFKGYTRFQFDLYVQQMLVRDYSLLAMLAVLAFLCHTLAPNKYVGYFAFIGILVASAFGWRIADVGTLMVRFASRPGIEHSDFYGYAPATPGWEWFTVYWSLFCVVLAIVSILLYRRGKETSWARRLGVARQRLASGLTPALVLTGAAFAATGAWVFYNTKVLNSYITPDDLKRRQADYEKTYKRRQAMPQPRILSVKYEIDLYPETRGVRLRAVQKMANRNAVPVSEVFYALDKDYEQTIDFPKARLQREDQRLGVRIYRLDPPMRPGEEREVRIEVKGGQKGFANQVERREFLQNGSFFNTGILPGMGYDPGRELSDRNDRRKHGLPEKDLMPELKRDCGAACGNTYISSSSDWVTVESVISTSPDQIAIAPGSLEREWRANGRRYFAYKLDRASLNFYSFLSARYEVAREEWNGVKLEVYFHPEHRWNVPRMITAMKKSLGYYIERFGPYAHRQARIIEFPRIAQFAQAFPGTMPYSESIGFIADLRDPEDIDHVFYIVAHEIAHQWWAHQVIGARVQGATLLSESLAQYSALMVMEKEYGRDMMRKFLEYEMDRYLRGRGVERLKERPLLRVEASQGYIHYQKASVALYYLKDMIGEEAMTRVLRDLASKFAYQGPPYPTSYEVVDRLREATPEPYRYLIRDLFEEITLFSNRTLTATAKKRGDGKYDVTVEVEAKKFKSDEKGNETEVAVGDWIEIGAFAKPAKGKKFGQTLHRERLKLDKARATFRFTVDREPDKAGIDPFHLLVDRTPGDNTKSVTIL